MILLIYLQILILCCFNLSNVSAIDCFQCISSNTTDKAACRTFTFDQWNVPFIKQCKHHIAGQSQEAFSCIKIVQQTIGEDGHLLKESIIRDCTSVPMKSGCEKRQVPNSDSPKRQNTMIQCVYLCNTDGCNSTNSLKSTSYLILISLIISIIYKIVL